LYKSAVQALEVLLCFNISQNNFCCERFSLNIEALNKGHKIYGNNTTPVTEDTQVPTSGV
jgi:hypothetical protein